MSSINLDLDFQDYTPTSGTSQSGTRVPAQQPEVQVRIPLSTDNAASFKQNIQSAKSVLTALQSVANLQTSQTASGSSSGGGLSDETLQQLIWLSGKQKNKQQRGSIAAGSNWGLGFFAQYFDVTTQDVLQRVLWSAVPVRKTGIDLDDLCDSELTAPLADNMAGQTNSDAGDQVNGRLIEQLQSKKKHYSYMERFIQSRPDFYGPFWVSTTIIFAVAIFSNIASFIQNQSRVSQVNLPHNGNISDLELSMMASAEKQSAEWHYSMDELNTTASVITSYVTLMPTFLWFLFWFRGCTKYYTLTETICAYGYSLSIFIPLAALLMIQALFFRYLVIVLASLLSGLVLVMSFLPVIQSDSSLSGSHFILVMVLVCQLGLAYILHRIMLIQ